jgi:hypothetical protein
MTDDTDGTQTRADTQLDLPTLPIARTRRKNGTYQARPPITEAQLHRQVAEFLDWSLLPPAMFTTFPAGWGKLGIAMAGRLRSCGLKPGMPDIMIFHRGHCLGLELKARKGRVSAAQKEMHEKLRRAGVPVIVCTSLDWVKWNLQRLAIPMRNVRIEHGSERPPAR